MKVTILGHYRVVHAGRAYVPGDVADVPDAVAANRIGWGWVESAEPQPEPEPPEQASDTADPEQAADDEPGTEAKPRRRR
ncbi:hypothetical protein OK015_18070 [Mycobacterium sp. Aquia_216]|uniref:hypothetical protein n=1 Tax=Mycobacterium sp. Aquia_216 TaxID=2991729 RepID=UPI00227AA4DB|nr:hypothetical protein [Mycobacterium sp. Aquia_216]WAJ43127.1 hypothetical protein OK015_18070 [Mycobacterium sp. Aquia_216]